MEITIVCTSYNWVNEHLCKSTQNMPSIVTVGVYTVTIITTLNIIFFIFPLLLMKKLKPRKVKQLAETQGLPSPYPRCLLVKVFIANHPRPFASSPSFSYSVYKKGKWKSLSHVWLFATPWTIYSLWNSLCQNTGVGGLSLLQGIFPNQGSNASLPHCKWILH